MLHTILHVLIVYLVISVLMGFIFVHNTPWWHRHFVMPPLWTILVVYLIYDCVYEKITGRSTIRK